MKQYFVISGARLSCDQSPLPSFFSAVNTWKINNKGVGRLTDFIPFLNVLSFGLPCKMLTQAASGVPTPCIPFPLPWQGTHEKGKGQQLRALLDTSSCRCAFGGKITVADAGQQIGCYDGPVLAVADPPATEVAGSAANIVVYHPPDKNTAPTAAHDKQLKAVEKIINQPELLRPNTFFLVGQHLYVTDALGRVVKVKGRLPLPVSPPRGQPKPKPVRNETAQGTSVRYKDGLRNAKWRGPDKRTPDQKKKGHQDYIPDPRPLDEQKEYFDQGGHLIGASFEGTPFHLNYVAQHEDQNQARTGVENWNAMEGRQRKALAAGKHVYVEYEMQHPLAGPPGSKGFGGYTGKELAPNGDTVLKSPDPKTQRDFSLRPDSFLTRTWIAGRLDEQPYPNS
ncbi:DNA/RNA non-specific endonuclease [Hymenobacter sp. H14-R3]|uniref:PAAR-like protein n=1 Tax=Hymenobacter sp. H14-R3 TaxID=3046308 RepID=UPI0024B9060C|nr:PAAR-like protein [Hymenobacter sp. H14-R3]MDJ0364706.1 DNA/RNA non-specific endonuclease [Hymenobacter sp. H14-R3]